MTDRTALEDGIPASWNEPSETDELRRTVESLREEIARVSDRGMKNGHMPRGTFVVDTVQGFSWCADPFCKGMDFQKPATSQRETLTQTNRQRDPAGDWNMASVDPDKTENSYERFFWEDPERYVCDVCNMPTLQFSMQERPRYERLSEQSPMELLKRKRSGLTPEKVIADAQAARAAEGGEIKELRDQLTRQQAALSFFMGQQSGSAQTMPADLVEMLTGTTTAPEPVTASESPVDPPAAVTAPRSGVKGYRQRGERYEALIYKSESEDGRQHAVGSFDTPEEALAARDSALSEATS